MVTATRRATPPAVRHPPDPLPTDDISAATQVWQITPPDKFAPDPDLLAHHRHHIFLR